MADIFFQTGLGTCAKSDFAYKMGSLGYRIDIETTQIPVKRVDEAIALEYATKRLDSLETDIYENVKIAIPVTVVNCEKDDSKAVGMFRHLNNNSTIWGYSSAVAYKGDSSNLVGILSITKMRRPHKPKYLKIDEAKAKKVKTLFNELPDFLIKNLGADASAVETKFGLSAAEQNTYLSPEFICFLRHKDYAIEPDYLKDNRMNYRMSLEETKAIVPLLASFPAYQSADGKVDSGCLELMLGRKGGYLLSMIDEDAKKEFYEEALERNRRGRPVGLIAGKMKRGFHNKKIEEERGRRIRNVSSDILNAYFKEDLIEDDEDSDDRKDK
jgi:hypothetical protein